jgi:hypothetical protein
MKTCVTACDAVFLAGPVTSLLSFAARLGSFVFLDSIFLCWVPHFRRRADLMSARASNWLLSLRHPTV